MSSLPTSARALVLPTFNQPLSLDTVELPAPVPRGSALVQIHAVTIRPHNREGFAGRNFLNFPLPFAPGNSAVGRVLATGDDAVCLAPGQLVWINGFVTSRDDPRNTHILIGLHANPEEKSARLFSAWKGLWRDVAAVPLENCIPLNEDLLVGRMGYSFGDLEYIERLAVAHGGISAAKLRPGQTVVVAPATGHYSGATAELAAQMGCQVIALTRSAANLQPLASRYPNNIRPVEVTGDVAVDTAAVRAVLPQAIGADAFIDVSPPNAGPSPPHFAVGMAVLRPHAQAILLGFLPSVSIDYTSVMLRNINIRGQWMYEREEAQHLVKMIEAGIVKLGKDAGHETVGGGFAFEDWEVAIEEAEKATQWGRQVLFMPGKKQTV